MISNNPFAKNDGTDPDWLARFVAQLDIRSKDECWEWKGAIKDKRKGHNYGIFRVDRIVQYVHRISYRLAHGVIPEDKPHVLHSCHNPLCGNFWHLKAGTHADNMKDKAEAGRAFRMIGSDHTNALLTEDQVAQIKTLWAEGELTGQQIGGRFGVSNDSISKIVTGKQWKHVTVDAEWKRKDPIVPNKPSCPHCHCNAVVSHGIRKNKSGDKRVFRCKSCDRIFTPPS